MSRRGPGEFRIFPVHIRMREIPLPSLSNTQYGAGPRVAGTERREEDVGPLTNASVLVRRIERHRNRGGRGVAVLLDVVDDFFFGQLETPRHHLIDSHVRLMRNEK